MIDRVREPQKDTQPARDKVELPMHEHYPMGEVTLSMDEHYPLGTFGGLLRRLAELEARERRDVEDFLRDEGHLRDYVDRKAGISIRGEVLLVAQGPQTLRLENGEQRLIKPDEVAVKVLERDRTPRGETWGLILLILRKAEDGSFVTVRSDQYLSGRLPFEQNKLVGW